MTMTLEARPDARKWTIQTRDLRAVVDASDQWDAWDTWRTEPAEKFGLIATAQDTLDGEVIPVRTETLMFRWGRVVDAEKFQKRASQEGLTK